MSPLRLGTRGSTLARLQSGLVADALRARGVEVDLVTVVTAGDVRPPDTAWGEGAFVTALETALLGGEVDLAVHSAKDVPIEPETDLVIAAYLPREEPRDCLVVAAGAPGVGSIDGLPRGARVGTDSPRRTGFLLAARPDLRVVPLHGNVDTRLARLDRGDVDALVLAVAGLTRLGRADRIGAVLPAELVPPAPGQGALAVQVRAADARVRGLVAGLDDAATRLAVEAERIVLHATGGGCRAPLGALATLRDGELRIVAAGVEPDGRHVRSAVAAGPEGESQRLAREVGERLLAERWTWTEPATVEAAK